MDDKRNTPKQLVSELESIKDLLSKGLSDDDSLDVHAKRAQSDQELLAENIESPLEIPVLNEVVIEGSPTTPLTKPDQLGKLTEQADTPIEQTSSGGVSDQRALLDTDKKTSDKEADEQTTAQQLPYTNSNENPFLPKHIRDRLTKPADLEAILAGDIRKIEKPVVLPPILKTAIEPKEYLPTSHSFVDSRQEQTLEDVFRGIPDNTQGKIVNDTTAHSKDNIEHLIDKLVAQYLPEIEAKLRFQLKQSLTKKHTDKTTRK